MEVTEEIKNKDYLYLEGYVITRVHNGEKSLVVVTGFDYYIGMTLQFLKKDSDGTYAEDDEGNAVAGRRATCYNGEKSPTPDAGTSRGCYNYDKWFMYALSAIENGVYDINESEIASDDYDRWDGGSGSVMCGFSA